MFSYLKIIFSSLANSSYIASHMNSRNMRISHIICPVAGVVALASCSSEDHVKIKDPITMMSPSPTQPITKVVLDEIQADYLKAGNRMALNFLAAIHDGENLICSPLSLQYALAMTANGASGETRQEIIDFLGYGEEGIDVLNDYSKSLLEQLPAVDMEVTLKVADALLVNNMFPLLPSFKETVETHYYAAVDNMDFNDPDYVAARINEWSGRNTNGFIDKVLTKGDVSPDAAAYLMNALYFKAKWAGTRHDPMFIPEDTRTEDFHTSGGKTVKVEMMCNQRYHEYAELDGYKVLVLPYAGRKFNMYVLLPDDNDIDGLVEKLRDTSWDDILGSLKQDAEVHVKLPKFEVEKKYELSDVLKSLGVEKAFVQGEAEFDCMFEPKPGYYYWINKVIQKSRIAVSEWGTEAGSVTVVEMNAESAMPSEPKKVYFHADRPFVFVIGEGTSGAILFEGVCMRP